MKRFLRARLFGACFPAFLAASCSSQEFQSDADVYRLQDLEYYGSLIEAYKVKTGEYPFF